MEDGAPGWEEPVLDDPWAIPRWHALGEGGRAEMRWQRSADAPGGLQAECPLVPAAPSAPVSAWPAGAAAVGAAAGPPPVSPRA